MPIEIRDWYEVEDVESEPEKLFIFADCLNGIPRSDKIKQICALPNTIGLPTRIRPGGYDSYLSDDDYVRVFNASLMARNKIMAFIRQGGTVVWPKGFGQGLSKLPARAPRIYDMYMGLLMSLIEADREQRATGQKLPA